MDIFSILENYGWYIVGASIIISLIWHKLKPTFEKYREEKAAKEYDAKYHKNPDLFQEKILARQKAVDRLQAKYKEDAENHLKELEEKEALKQEALRAKYSEEEQGHVLGSATTSKGEDKKSFKPEYNPLMGSGSGSSYRAPKKGKCGGGGCGR